MTRRPPVTPNATQGARDLLERLYDVSGKQILSGQHNQSVHGSDWTEKITGIAGATPVVWGQELGFSAPGTLDGIDFRQANVEEAIRRHKRGAIITLTWHAVGPDEDEPVVFQGGIIRDLDPASFDELLTPGTEIHTRWLGQVDVIAGLLKQLQDADVPVLWRPYHEMNGGWFWWGAEPTRYERLWRQLFDRLVNHHGLRNLIWVWSPGCDEEGETPIPPYFPGGDVVDALGQDTYSGKFRREEYDGMVALADGRPIGWGEFGAFPSAQVLDQQPLWSWFLAWPNNVTEANTPEATRELYADPRVVTLDPDA
jgi:mannan endo-1,4-beta-mannosidase